MLLDAAFALAWCSRYEPWERRRSSDRLGVWSVRALIPLGQLTILAGTIATASGPHAGAHEGQLVHRFTFEGSGDAGMGGPAPRRARHRLRPRRDRRLVPPAPPRRRQAGRQAADRGPRPPGPAGRRRRPPVGAGTAERDRLGPRRARHRATGWRCCGRSPPRAGCEPRARIAPARRPASRAAGRRRRPLPRLLPFWLSIGVLSLVQAAAGRGPPRRRARRSWSACAAAGGRWCCRSRSSS